MSKTYIMLECTKEEKELIKQRAKKMHLTMSAYIRLVLFNGIEIN